MKNGDIFEACGVYLLYMGDKIYLTHRGGPLIESEVRLGGFLKGWTVYTQPLYLSSESELRRRKPIINIGKRMLLRFNQALKGETRYCGPCFAESSSLEEATLYYDQMQRLDALWAQIKCLQWRT